MSEPDNTNLMESHGELQMQYLGSRELVCYATGVEVLRMVEPDTHRAHDIANAIHRATKLGEARGRRSMLREIELKVRELNRWIDCV